MAKRYSETQLFQVTLSNFSAINLPIKDIISRKADAFVRGSFDHYKKFQTKYIPKDLNPKWDFQMTFQYRTRYVDKLQVKTLHLDVYDMDRFKKNDFIGSVDVDLQTLAMGPISHDLLLRNKGKASGRLRFDCAMEHICVIEMALKDLKVSGGLDETKRIYPLIKLMGIKSAKAIKGASNTGNYWPDTDAYQIPVTVKQLLQSNIVVEFKEKKTLGSDVFLGSVNIPLVKWFSVLTADRPVRVQEPFKNPQMEHVGDFNCILYYSNPPLVAPMKAGLHTEVGILDGEPLHPDLPVPDSLRYDSSAFAKKESPFARDAAPEPPSSPVLEVKTKSGRRGSVNKGKGKSRSRSRSKGGSSRRRRSNSLNKMPKAYDPTRGVELLQSRSGKSGDISPRSVRKEHYTPDPDTEEEFPNDVADLQDGYEVPVPTMVLTAPSDDEGERRCKRCSRRIPAGDISVEDADYHVGCYVKVMYGDKPYFTDYYDDPSPTSESEADSG